MSDSAAEALDLRLRLGRFFASVRTELELVDAQNLSAAQLDDYVQRVDDYVQKWEDDYSGLFDLRTVSPQQINGVHDVDWLRSRSGLTMSAVVECLTEVVVAIEQFREDEGSVSDLAGLIEQITGNLVAIDQELATAIDALIPTSRAGEV